MKKFLLTLVCIAIIILNNNQTYSQALSSCGTQYTPDPNFNYQTFQQFSQQTFLTSVQIPIQFHIVRHSNGTGGVSYNDIQNQLTIANTQYSNSNLNFFECASVNYIDDDNLYIFEQGIDEATLQTHDVPNVLNIYYPNTVQVSGGQYVGGYSFFPWWSNPQSHYVIIAESNHQDNSTLAHEIGHYFGLLHTHETANGIEYVNGTNCSTAGDLLCDTPADPGLYTCSNSACQFICTTLTDPLGQFYSPLMHNIMSYVQYGCANSFTGQQNTRSNFYYLNGRNYLTCTGSCSQPSHDGCNGLFTATPLSFGTTCNPISSSTCGATNSGFSSCVGNSDDDVFFSFTPTSSTATITITPTSGFDAVFQVLTGPCGFTMQQLACVNSNGNGGIETTTLNALSSGTQYFIRVWHYGSGYGTTNGDFTICVYGSSGCSAPPHDICPNATSLPNPTSTCNYSSGTTCGATNSNIGSCWGTQDDDVWYVFQANSNSTNINVQSSLGFDAVFQVLSSPCSGSMIQYACINNTGNGGLESTTVTTTPGTSYYIRVWDYNPGYGTTGNFQICVFNPFVGQPNLFAQSGGAGTTGNIANYNYTVTNNGTANAGSFYINFYVCNTPSFTNPIWVGSDFVSGGLSMGSSYSASVNIDLCNAGVPNGSYYLGFYIDYANQVSNELDETDNNTFYSSSSFPINCTVVGQPNLFALSGSAGTTLNIANYTYTINNNGTANAGSFYINFYACTSPSFLNPYFIGSDYVSAGLSVGASYTSSTNIDLCLAGLASGSYYLGFYIDYSNQIANELDETDNNTFYPFNPSTITCGSGQAPVADFYANDLIPVPFQTDTFYDLSSFVPTSWFWSISPGTYAFQNSTPTSQNPYIMFTATGLYTISLQVSNAFGSNTETKVSYIDVRNCSFSISPPSATFNNNGGTGYVQVTDVSSAGCAWLAGYTAPWVTILYPTSQIQGNAQVVYSVSPCSGADRDTTITMAGNLFYVHQSCATTGIANSINNFNMLNVYPNPTDDLLNIKGDGLDNGNFEIILTNVLGQQLKKELVKVFNHSIEAKLTVKELSSGIYFLSVSSNKIKQTFKVQKQ